MMTLAGRALREGIAAFRTFVGLIYAVALSLLPIVLIPALILAPPEPDVKDALLRTAVFLLFILPGVMFLNMANFFARLKRANPLVYSFYIRDGHWFQYLARSGRSVLTNLHYRVSQLSTDRSGQIGPGLRFYATLTRYFNRFVIAYIICGVVLALAFGIHASVGSRH